MKNNTKMLILSPSVMIVVIWSAIETRDFWGLFVHLSLRYAAIECIPGAPASYPRHKQLIAAPYRYRTANGDIGVLSVSQIVSASLPFLAAFLNSDSVDQHVIILAFTLLQTF